MKTKLSAYKLFRAGLLAFVLVIMACASVVFAKEKWEVNGKVSFSQDYIQPAVLTVTCDCPEPHTMEFTLGSEEVMKGKGLEGEELKEYLGTYDQMLEDCGNGKFGVKITNLQFYVDKLNEASGVEHFLPEGQGTVTTAYFEHQCGTQLGFDGSIKGVYFDFSNYDCNAPVTISSECHICGKKSSVTLPAGGHIFDNSWDSVSPSCTEPGGKWGTCLVCGQSGWIDDDWFEPAKGHRFNVNDHRHTEGGGIEVYCRGCYNYVPLTEEDLAGLDFSQTGCKTCNPTTASDDASEDQGTLTLAHKTVVAANAARVAVAQVGGREGVEPDRANAPLLKVSGFRSGYFTEGCSWGTGEGPHWTNAALNLVVTTKEAPASSEYTVKWVTTNDEGEEVVLDEETRDDVKAEDTAKVTDADKAKIIDGYVFDAANENNVLEEVVAADGSTVLVLYMKKSETPLYTVHWVDVATGRDLRDPEVRDDYAVGDLAQVTEPDKAVTFTGYKFRADLDQKWSDVITENGEVHLYLYYEAEGGGNNPGGDPETPPENPPENPPTTPDEPNPGEDIPTPDVPLTDLPVENPPLTELPEEETPLEDIPEEETPLSGVPETGDISALWTVMALLTGAGLIWMVLDSKKRKEDA